MLTETKQIYIVDDNPDMHELIEFFLQEAFESDTKHEDIKPQYTFHSCYQGEEIVDKIRSLKDAGQKPALIVMDVRMPPGIDGIQALKQVWITDQSIPVVICTAFSDYTEEEIRGMFTGPTNLCIAKKPLEKRTFVEITNRFLKK